MAGAKRRQITVVQSLDKAMMVLRQESVLHVTTAAALCLLQGY